MTKLKPVNIGMNTYCGPAVLSILTGKNTDDCVAAIRKVYPQYAGAEVPYDTLLAAADRLGFDSKRVPAANSLYGTLVRLAAEDGIYIILVPRHVVTIEVQNKTAFFCDNHTKEPIPAASSARLMQKVLDAHKITERPRPPEPPKPVYIESMYTIALGANRIDIFKKDIYENHKDNKELLMNSIRCKDTEERDKVIEALKETFCESEL